MESVGVRLKKLRLEKGLSLEEVHKETKIHLNILKAIEEDNPVGLNPIYIKGFLKIYCRLLGADPKDYITGFHKPDGVVKEISPVAGKVTPFIKETSLRPPYFRRLNIKIRIKTIVIIVSIIFLLVGLFNLGKFVSLKRIPRAKATKLSVRVVDKTEKGKAQTAQLEWTQKDKKIMTAVQTQDAIVSKNKAVSSGIRLGMRAKENCWVHLAVDGKVVFHAILKKDKFESWQAKEKIEFSLGNAGAVELELNGKVIPPLGRRGQAIKDVLVNKKQGLVVGR